MPVSDYDPDLPERPFGGRIVKGFLRDGAVEREDMSFRYLPVILIGVDMFQHPQVIEHLGFCPLGHHHIPAFSQRAHFFERERVSFNRG